MQQEKNENIDKDVFYFEWNLNITIKAYNESLIIEGQIHVPFQMANIETNIVQCPILKDKH